MFLTTSRERVGLRPERQGCQRQVTAVLLAIGRRQGGSDFHYGNQCAQAG